MYRFTLEVYLGKMIIFCKEFKSLTSIARCIDCFGVSKDLDLIFSIFDTVKGIDIDSKELIRIWNS